MFNLIMLYDGSDWQVPLNAIRTATFPLARLFEYTIPDIEGQFTPVVPSSLARLAGLPTVFMTELQSDRQKPGGTVRVKIGRVFALSIESTEIRYSFVIERDFGPRTVPDLKPFENAFGMGKLEIHRSHWAVKSHDVVGALRAADLLNQNEDWPAPAPSLAVPLNPVPPLPVEPRPASTVVENLEQFMQVVMTLQVPPDHEVFYRGHSDSRYKLEPSLYRKTASGEYKYLQNEARMILELLSAQSSAFSSDAYMLDRLVRMQHFGLPTRLLDVTSNPLVGLYFCCSTAKFDQSNHEIDGEVIILTTPKEQVRFFESDTVSCIANLAMLEEQAKDRLDTGRSLEAFNRLPECGRLLHFIRREKPYFEARIVPSDLESIQFVRARSTHERIMSQSGAFLIFGKDAVLPETGHSGLNIRRVTVRNKQSILEQLAKLNIKSSTIYPGLEKTTAEIAKQYELLG